MTENVNGLKKIAAKFWHVVHNCTQNYCFNLDAETAYCTVCFNQEQSFCQRKFI